MDVAIDLVFFFKQKTAYEMRISDWSSDVCSSDLKTTLLKIIAGLLPATGGEVRVDGRTVTGPGPERAFVFQDFALMPWANVIRNVAFGLELRGIARSEREAVAAKYIGQVGLKGFEKAYPLELSEIGRAHV